MINRLETIKDNLASFDSLSPYPLRPFWDMPAFDDDPFWGPGLCEASSSKTLLVVSGPARNGNHLLHSMLDDHPQLPQSPGEDSFLAAFFEDVRRDRDEARRKLTGPDNVDYVLSLSGFGHNKWKTRYEMSRDTAGQTTSIWAGIQDGVRTSVADYQDTMVAVDYPAYESCLLEHAEVIRRAPTFMDALWLYLDAFARLDPERRTGRFSHLYVGSGMRAELKFVLDRSDRVRCVTPVRPFESYYYSFARGRAGSDAVTEDVLHEAWEHWWHKVVDYLLLMREFPDRLGIVSFVHLVEEPEASSREICRLLDIAYDDSCLTPTSLGRTTKGNSSFPKEEHDRGRLYKTPLERSLPQAHWPELYPALWRMVSKLSI